MTGSKPVRSSLPFNSSRHSSRRSRPDADDVEARLWLSDRDIGAGEKRAEPAFSASDYRNELERVERNRLRVAIAVIAVLVAVLIVVFFAVTAFSHVGSA